MNWASPRSLRGQVLIDQIQKLEPDVAIFTEAKVSWLEKLGGHLALAAADYGYESSPDRRKVAIWSSKKILSTDTLGSDVLPSGRYVQGQTHGITVVGLCIPWRDAHVRTGRRDKVIWQDHRTYLRGLQQLPCLGERKLVVAGDFNQRNPRYRQPSDLFDALSNVFEHLDWLTLGDIYPLEKLSIDHILISKEMQAGITRGLSNHDGAQLLSDHFGVFSDISHSQAKVTPQR